MTSFIYDVLKSLKDKGRNLTSITFILPSKRAGLFLTQEFSKVLGETSFSPEIISIEDFVEELSQLKKENNTELLFQLYSAHISLSKEEDVESFEEFIKWGQILLQDFNEIDRYLVEQEKLFDYLNAIQELNHWSKSDEKTTMIANYLSFWNGLYDLYKTFQESLLNQGVAYQGLIYREALENLESYIQNTSRKEHIFLGFNALNKAEETIIQELLENNMAEIFWDIDSAFMNSPVHDAGLFLRKYKSEWHYYKKKSFDWITNHFTSKKNITAYAVSKNTGLAKHIGHLLESIQKTNPVMESTAVVLADESLLIPLLNSIPECVENINITMGLPLNKIPLASLFEKLLKIHSNSSSRFYHKDVIALLSHPYIQLLYFDLTHNALAIIEAIETNNHIYLTLEQLLSFDEAPESIKITQLLFSNWHNKPSLAIKKCTNLIFEIKNRLDSEKRKNLLQLEYLFRFHTIFNELDRLNKKFNYITNIKTLHIFFDELLNSETLDFQGEPLKGLQIMGMLESRVLDFETVILASVNEGFLPAGKTNNSFIPYDVKLNHELPTYKEKDAIYAYHFYHLLQRAKNIHLLYNSEVDTLNGGEKSRFLTQLEVDKVHEIKQLAIAPKTVVLPHPLKHIDKDQTLINKLKQIAEKGFSPSSLTSYIRNPIDFYYQKVLGIKEYNEVEETIADNTLGTIIHNTLEDFYLPYLDRFIMESDIVQMIPKIKLTIEKHFKEIYKSGDLSSGKNLIIFEVAQRYVLNFLKLELKNLKHGHSIKIIGIEKECEAMIEIPELDFDIKIKGVIDRIDLYDGVTRIIDYKTGRVEPIQVQIVEWDHILTDYKKYSKSFQILMYVFTLQQSGTVTLPVEAGIISFKNLNQGFIKFTKKDKPGSGAQKDTFITQEILLSFEKQLQNLILEIFDEEIPFLENKV